MFVPKNEIDPQMQVGRDVITFQCFAVNANEFTGVAMRPFWKHDVTQDRAVLSFPEVQLDEEGRRRTKKASISQSREREIGPETNLPVKSIFWKEKK